MAVIHCDQAIFTSVRGPMAEGYRVVAASRGLRPDEKQAITKLSPSHDSLCWQPSDDAGGSAYAAAFYPLPTGRLCVALSCHAGAEHTGRGGHRVYTQNVIFDGRALDGVGCNPFHVVRGMLAAGLGTPRLDVQGVVDELELKVDVGFPADLPRAFAAALRLPHARRALTALFGERGLIVPLRESWVEAAEVLLLSLPSPLRMKIAFAAGLRFSLGRSHRMYVLVDEKNAAKARVVGQRFDYLDADPDAAALSASSTWTAFVERHWVQGKVEQLARRTVLSAEDCGLQPRERIASLYNTIDSIASMPIVELFRLALRSLSEASAGSLENIRRELVGCAQSELLARLGRLPWREVVVLWPEMVRAWSAGEAPARFVGPLSVAALRSALKEDVAIAAEAALDLASQPARELDAEVRAAIDEVLR